MARRRTWIASVSAASWFLSASDALAHAVHPDRGPFRNGVEHTLAAFDQLLPLLGLAIVLGRGGARRASVGVGALLAGVAIALTVAELVPATSVQALAPSSLVVVGAALLAPPSWRGLAPVASGWLGLMLGLSLAVDIPVGLSWTRFALGVLGTEALAFAIPLALVVRFARPWFRIPARILGSWLLTIGILLYGLRLRA